MGFSGYAEECLKYIDAQQLPVEFGGQGKYRPLSVLFLQSKFSCECALFAVGRFAIRTGGPATEDGRGGAVVQTVSSRFEVHVEVSDVGTTIYWDFTTREHDIGFGILVNGQVLENHAIERHNCSMEPVSGSHRCRQAGKYTLVWDNSYSLWRSKVITYKVDAYKPAENILADQ